MCACTVLKLAFSNNILKLIYEVVGKLYVYYYYRLINIIHLKKYQLHIGWAAAGLDSS